MRPERTARSHGQALPFPEHGLRLAYLYGGVAQYRAGEVLEPRVLPDYEVVLGIQGNISYNANGKKFAVPPGGIVFSRPGFHEAYAWDRSGPTRLAYFHFDFAEPPVEAKGFQKWPIVRTHPDPVLPVLIRHVVDRIYRHAEWPAGVPGPLDCLVVETFLAVLRESWHVEPAEFERTRPAHVGRAINWMRQVIDTEPHRQVRLKELAEVSGVSEQHLCRSFHDHLGHSPVQTHRLLCMQLALALLSRSDLRIQQIADRCGFTDPAYFTRYFTKTFGASPVRVRERLRRGRLPPSSPLPVDVMPRLFW